jgi:hypothetical protein
MPLVFVFIGLLPFTELTMKPEVRDIPVTLRRQFAFARSACAWSSVSASPILCFSSPVGKLFLLWELCNNGKDVRKDSPRFQKQRYTFRGGRESFLYRMIEVRRRYL